MRYKKTTNHVGQWASEWAGAVWGVKFFMMLAVLFGLGVVERSILMLSSVGLLIKFQLT